MTTGSSILLPPPASVWKGGGGSGWVELIRARGDIDAHLLVGRLVEAGVETRTVKDRSAPWAWMHAGSNPWAPVSILVRRVQLEDARLVLAEISFAAPPATPRRTEAPRTAGWSGPVLWWSVALALGAIFTAIGLIQTVTSMEQCVRGACAQPAGDAP
jgi:Putative prokaryotic signal transducing protein